MSAPSISRTASRLTSMYPHLLRAVAASTGAEGRPEKDGPVVLERVQVEMKVEVVRRPARGVLPTERARGLPRCAASRRDARRAVYDAIGSACAASASSSSNASPTTAAGSVSRRLRRGRGPFVARDGRSAAGSAGDECRATTPSARRARLRRRLPTLKRLSGALRLFTAAWLDAEHSLRSPTRHSGLCSTRRRFVPLVVEA